MIRPGVRDAPAKVPVLTKPFCRSKLLHETSGSTGTAHSTGNFGLNIQLGAVQLMKLIALLLLLAAGDCCLGQTDTNLIAAGDWSEVVPNTNFPNPKFAPCLRGRLLVYDAQDRGGDNHARVYLELQHADSSQRFPPVAVYYAPDGTNLNLHFEMRDENDRPIPNNRFGGIIWGPRSTQACWVTIPYDATVRLRADSTWRTQKPDGLEIDVGGGRWIIPPHATNGFYLSGTFRPQCDKPGLLKYESWQGTLKLPKVKIVVK
jgi:hypothetical protein